MCVCIFINGKNVFSYLSHAATVHLFTIQVFSFDEFKRKKKRTGLIVCSVAFKPSDQINKTMRQAQLLGQETMRGKVEIDIRNHGKML